MGEEEKTPPVRYLKLKNGDRMAYVHWPGVGTPLVLLHGMGSSRQAFYSLMDRRPYPGPSYALDLPGFGASSLPSGRQDLDDFVRAVANFLTALNLPPVLLLGHSFGGMVAGETAIAYPHRIRGVILVATAGVIEPEHALQPTPYVCINRLGIWLMGLDCFGNRMLTGLGLDPARLSASVRRRMRYGWRRAREMARMGTFYQSPQLADRLTESGVPVVAIHGNRDLLFPLEKILATVSGRFPVLVQPGAGHLPYDYDLDAFLCLFHRAVSLIQRGSPA